MNRQEAKLFIKEKIALLIQEKRLPSRMEISEISNAFYIRDLDESKSIDVEGLAVSRGIEVGMGLILQIIESIEKSEEQLYEEALRATCSLCVIENRCVCGELDPIDEEE